MHRSVKIVSLVAALSLAACGGGNSETRSVAPASQYEASQDTLGLGRAPGQSLDDNIADNAREKATTVSSVYRFAKISSGAYFYTGSTAERDQIIANFSDFRYEGPAFGSTPGSGGVPVYRFAKTDSGGYFFTSNTAERDLIINSGAYPNFRYEGVTFAVAEAGTQGAVPVYRLANLANGSYLLTQDARERAAAVASGVWRDEGIGFYAYPSGHVISDSSSGSTSLQIAARAARMAGVAIGSFSWMGNIADVGRKDSVLTPFDGTCEDGGTAALRLTAATEANLTLLECRFASGTAATAYGGTSNWTLAGMVVESGATFARYKGRVFTHSIRRDGAGADIRGTLRIDATQSFDLKISPRETQFAGDEISLNGLSGDLEGSLLVSGLKGKLLISESRTVGTTTIEGGTYRYSGPLGTGSGEFVPGGNIEVPPLDPNRPPPEAVRVPDTEPQYFLSKDKNCTACHAIEKNLVGPAYVAIATRYAGATVDVRARLEQRVRAGGTGSWGQILMPANPRVSAEEARVLVEWILSF